MPCPRCAADPQPTGFGSPRACAFADGVYAAILEHERMQFTANNWNCATITALVLAYDPDGRKTIYGNDESLDLIPAAPRDEYYHEPRGWIVLSRYKRRGCVSSAVYVGDWSPTKPVTLKLVDDTILYWQEHRERT